jgi:TrmH family RNA methyltransferase
LPTKSDLYSPNIVRSSVGCCLQTKLQLEQQQNYCFLKEKKINLLLYKIQQRIIPKITPTNALVVGTEATGLTQEWRDAATQNIIILMQVKLTV